MTRSPTTEDLIRDLAGRPAPARMDAAATVALLLAAVATTVAVFFLIFGPRPDLWAALPQPAVLAKIALPVLLAVAALGLALRSARPGARLRLWVLAVPVLVAAGLFVATLAVTPADQVGPGIMGGTALACLISITLLSAPAILLGVMLFRRGAAVRPGLTGALIGLAASASATAGYALHCTEDSPLFYATWYGLAMLICTGLGGFAGQRLLRW